MADEPALVAAAALVRSLAVQSQIPLNAQPGSEPVCRLPGPNTAAKALLERELSALAARVHRLEAKDSISPNPIFPDTPSETVDSMFGVESSSPSSNNSKSYPRSKPPAVATARSPAQEVQTMPLTDEALEGLRGHIDDQSKLLDNQRQELTNVNAQLMEQKHLQERALKVLEEERVAALERELWKHQKANEAFQKALREIGEIVTAVAHGDLSKRVRMNSVEMDPEITTFKRTINTMMDQLQVFSSEVSRVAREVGTDGILGGQAMIAGVDGTWKELTDNGKLIRAMFWIPALIYS